MCSIHIGGIAIISEWYSLIIAPVAQTEEHLLSKEVVLVQLHSGADEIDRSHQVS